jgi:hypothetical protein
VFTLGDAMVEAGSDTQAGSPPGQGPSIAQKLAKVALTYVASVTSAATVLIDLFPSEIRRSRRRRRARGSSSG